MAKILGHTESWIDGIQLDINSPVVASLKKAFGEVRFIHACFEIKVGDKLGRITIGYPTKELQGQGVAVIETDTPEQHERVLKALVGEGAS